MWDFEVVAIKKAKPQAIEEKGNWYHYTIANKITTVNGYRRGSKAEVSQFVNSCIQRLNVRHLGTSGQQPMSP